MRTLRGLSLVVGGAFRRMLYDKRTLALMFLCALPVLFAYLTVTFDTKPRLNDVCGTMFWLVLQTAVPLAALVGGVAVLGDEIDGRTITYLYTRPLARPLYYLGRMAGHFAAGGLLLTIAIVLAFWQFGSVIDLTVTDVLGSVGITLLGLATYSALFSLLRLFFKRALFIGFIVTFIFEGWVAKLPVGGFAKNSVWHHLAVLQYHLLEGGGFIELPKSIDPEEAVNDSFRFLGIVLVVSLAVGAWLVRSREIKLPAASA